MTFAALLLCSLAFAETKTLAVQIALDQAGFSCNTIDGQWGAKSQRALECYCRSRRLALPDSPESAYDRFFAGSTSLFRIHPVAEADIAAIVEIPSAPADKARLAEMGYGSILEMFAERGHLSRRALERMNPGIDWANPSAGLKLVIPDFPAMDREIRQRDQSQRPPAAAFIRISLSRFEVAAFAADGAQLALFPCSIARDKAKLPPSGELKIVSMIPRPNYTYSPDFVPRGQKARKYIFPGGPRCPVGIVWLGLNLPGYGIHGTPKPESIGSAESHGCFRLANWNAARLYALSAIGTRVLVEQ